MENFKEIAEKCLKGELSGTFITRIGKKIPSYKLKRNNHVVYKYQFNTVDTYSDEGRWYLKCETKLDIVDFIPYKDMETKETKIEVPEGYEIDKENSSFEKIIFKPKEDKYPKSWEDFCKRYKGDVFWINTFDSSIGRQTITDIMYPQWAQNTLPTKELAKKFLAYMQLMSLRHEWIHIWSQEQRMEKDWEPNWDARKSKACITCYRDEPGVESWQLTTFPLSFPTVELACKFLQCFKDLLISAKGLY